MNIAIVLSGGTGHRMGLNMPKQYIRVSGKLLITYCLETLLAHPMIDAVQIAAEEEWRESILIDAQRHSLDTGKICGFSAPGTERQFSVFNALEDIKASGLIYETVDKHKGMWEQDAVLIHDAARPNLSGAQIIACFDALKEHDGAMPVLPMKDTVYLSDGGERIAELLERDKVFAGQAPEAFDLEQYYEANRKLLPDGLQRIKGSTEPAIMAGMDIAMIPGDENNYKITTKADLERFRKQREMDWS